MRPRSRDDFAIAIICALPLEVEAVEALFDETYDRLGRCYSKQRGDANAYINGRIGKYDVVLCYMPEMGKRSAAGVASSLLVSYPGVRLALVVGICGGAPQPPKYEEIFLGDVIISDSVIEYDFGRQYPGGFQRKTGVKETLGRPDREIRALLDGLRAENARRELQDRAEQYLHSLQQTGTKWRHPGVNDILFKAEYLHKHYCQASAECSCLEIDSPEEICEEALGQDCDSLECNQGQAVRRRGTLDAIQTLIYIGTIASADTVMKSGQHRDDIVRKEKVIGFEMEGAGVWDNVPCIIVKGVCDYADSHKNKLWQAYAAATGASAAKALLEYWMPNTREIHGPTTLIKHHHVMIPFARNPHFVGRQGEIQKIEDLITVPHGPRKLAITGLGGVGKTQIALELVYRMRDREPECSIYWIPCTSYEAVEQACMSIAQMVGLHGVEPAEVKERVQSYFSQTNKKWIFIFDNADEMEMWTKGSPTAPPLKNIIPRGENGHVLLTSRNRQLALKLAASNVVSVPDVDQKTGKEILRKLLMRKDLLQDDHVTSMLLEKLAFLPLAISQAAAYINQTDISLATYMVLLGEQEASTIELLSEDFEDEGRYAEIQNPVATTWLVSFMQIYQVDQIASNYLSFMACVNPRYIPESILPATTSAKRKVEALGLLKAYFFVSAQVDDSILSLHRLVHLATRNWLRKGKSFESWVKQAADQLDKVFPDSNHDNRQKWRDYLPHALYLANSAEFQAYQDNYHDFLTRTGSCLQSDGRHGEAEIVFRNVLEIRERACGLEHPDTLVSVDNLGSVHADQGKSGEGAWS
ncbi:putative kinesin light chain [Aspergillus spinulosporus]